MNLDFLKAKIIEKGLTQKEVAEEIGINPKTLNAKLNGREKMTLQDFHKIVKILILNSQELELMVHEMFKARKVIQRSEV
ncbi:MAG: helix-turn-helix transcriptional regulator [Tissierellales bacterium]|jgi:transcriptional regulator with XRE-family HTH domain|nr:helix-turn-helix transcriptional regulator [Tissierellales bacterium]